MSEVNLNEIPNSVEKAEQSFTWFIKNFIRGSWFRRCVILFVLTLSFASPPVASKVFSIFEAALPASYTSFYYIGLGVLAVVTIVVGYFTLPKDQPVQPPVKTIRGLLPLGSGDRDLFKKLCREVDVAKILSALGSDRFRLGVLVGTSGSGKSSLLRAGIVPRLSGNGTLATYAELSNEPPITSINRAFERQSLKSPAGVLILDQFEQFFLHQRTTAERQPLIAALKRWFDRDSGVRVLISIRAEDAWQMIEIQEAVGFELTNENHFRLLKFDTESAVAVLGVLCEEAGIVFNQSFAREIVEREMLDADGRVSPVNLGIIVLVLASWRASFTADSFKTHGGIPVLLEEWLQTQLDAVQVQGLDKVVTRVLTALCDLETNRRAGALTEEEITSRLNDHVPPRTCHQSHCLAGSPRSATGC